MVMTISRIAGMGQVGLGLVSVDLVGDQDEAAEQEAAPQARAWHPSPAPTCS